MTVWVFTYFRMNSRLIIMLLNVMKSMPLIKRHWVLHYIWQAPQRFSWHLIFADANKIAPFCGAISKKISCLPLLTPPSTYLQLHKQRIRKLAIYRETRFHWCQIVIRRPWLHQNTVFPVHFDTVLSTFTVDLPSCKILSRFIKVSKVNLLFIYFF